MTPLTDQQRKDAISEGVYNWMVDHPLSAADGLALGAERGVARWLNEHAADQIDRIISLVVAARVAEKKS